MSWRDKDHPIWSKDHPIWQVVRLLAACAASLAIHWAGASSFDSGEVISAVGTMAATAVALRR